MAEDFENLKYTILYYFQVKPAVVLQVITPYVDTLNDVYINELYNKLTTGFGSDFSLLAYNIITVAKVNQDILNLVKLIIQTCEA